MGTLLYEANINPSIPYGIKMEYLVQQASLPRNRLINTSQDSQGKTELCSEAEESEPLW